MTLTTEVKWHDVIQEQVIDLFEEEVKRCLRDNVSLVMAWDKAVHSFRKRRYVKGRTAAEKVRAACLDHLEEAAQSHSAAWRMAFTTVQCMLAAAHMQDTKFVAASACLDEAFVRGGPDSLMAILELMAQDAASHGCTPAKPTEKLLSLTPTLEQAQATMKSTGLTMTAPGRRMAVNDTGIGVFKQMLADRVATCITDLQEGWQASARWPDLAQLEQEYGHRLIPLEIGRWPDLKEELVTVSHFLRQYMQQPSDAEGSKSLVAYCAQHALFNQLSGLRDDFVVPPIIETVGRSIQDVNAWWGTADTLTPLHWDAYDNFLAQCVGFKYVRLYSASESQYLYPKAQGETASKKNLSCVNDVDHVDEEAFPLFSQATFTEHLLGPGDTLFIPESTWHYVRSLSPSMSINFWF